MVRSNTASEPLLLAGKWQLGASSRSPKIGFSRTLRGSCREQNASSEQAEAGVTIHLALDQF